MLNVIAIHFSLAPTAGSLGLGAHRPVGLGNAAARSALASWSAP